MKKLGILMLVCWVWGCGEKRDELTPYVERLQGLQHYNETLVRYKRYLHTEGMTHNANDLAQILKNYQSDLDAIGRPDNKPLLALHNEMIRKFDEALRILVEPDFPTFVPNAQRAVALKEQVIVRAHNNLRRMWENARKTEPFPLQWPEDIPRGEE